MLSTFPATLSGDSFVGNPFPLFELGFPSFEHHEPAFLIYPQEPVSSGSDNSNPSPVPSPTGSDEPCKEQTKNSSSGSGSDDEPDRKRSKKLNPGPNIDERKRRRMISNRESARRSRMRKQKHLENLRNQVNRLKVGNRELMNRVRLVVHQTQLFNSENEYLRSEAVMLRQRLWDIRQVLLARQLLNPVNNINNNHGLLLPINSLIN